MKLNEDHRCPRCGATLPANASDEACPACLLSGALADADGLTETLTLAAGGPLSTHGPGEFPYEFGGYRLLGLLGRGGMGTVYESEEIATGRRLALKMLGRDFDSPEMRQRFLREGRLAARVNHPHSLYVFGSEEIEGIPVITMEIAGRGTLKDQLKTRGPLPVTDAVDAILDVVSGLESALAHGVLHRDIKPSNCFVGPDGSVKVGDFGLSVSTLAKTDTFVTAHGKIMGTPAYASPEQLRGDQLDVHADIYSVGATLFTLLTDRAPFEGDNAVQVVANAVNQDPPKLATLRDDIPAELERIVTRCLAKEPDARFADYPALRTALLPFSSREPEPASMAVRVAAGWIDGLLAFLPPYVVVMFWIGGERLFVDPLIRPSVHSARYYLALLGVGFLYFMIGEGLTGAGVGKRLKGLRVVDADGRPPGPLRALVRIALPVLCMELVRFPLMLALISPIMWSGRDTLILVLGAVVCGWIPALLALPARRENRFATLWDRVSGTRVVIRPEGMVRPPIESRADDPASADDGNRLGPYQRIEERVPGKWIVARDPVLRRSIWLLRRNSGSLSRARRDIGRPGRLRWLQGVESGAAVWDAFEGPSGSSFSQRIADGRRVPWSTLRHWLHDLACELYAAAGDRTLPDALSLEHVWITDEGRALILEERWPVTAAENIPVADLAGQQRFISSVASHVERSRLPLHARGVLKNLEQGAFEKLSFLTGVLRGLLERPADVSRGMRAGSMLMIPLYVWIAMFVGRYHDKPVMDALGAILVFTVLVVLGAFAVVELVSVPFRSSIGFSIFRLAVIDEQGDPATRARLLARWAVIWLPLIVGVGLIGALIPWTSDRAWIAAAACVALWGCGALVAVVRPHRGLHDRLAGTRVVRR